MLQKKNQYTHNLEKDLFEGCSNYVVRKDEIRERIKHIPTNEKNEIRKYQCIAMRCILYELLGE